MQSMLLTMAWNSEIKDATYTSPSGKTYTFRYGQLSKETELKTATFTFPEKDGALVVPLGVGGRTFPMSCFFMVLIVLMKLMLLKKV